MNGSERTFVMIDLAGFAALTEAHGDDYAADFADLARANLGPEGHFVKALADAVLPRRAEPLRPGR